MSYFHSNVCDNCNKDRKNQHIKWKTEYGNVFWFCSKKCKKEYQMKRYRKDQRHLPFTCFSAHYDMRDAI